MRRNQRLFLVLAVLVCAAFLMPSGAFAKDKTKLLRLVVPTPPNEYPLSTGLDEMAQKFNARAQGEYKIEVFAGGALVKMPEYFDALRIGAVEIGSVAWTIFAFLDPRLGVIETPFLFNNNEAATYAAKDLVPLYDEIFQQKFNTKALGLYAVGSGEFLSTKPVKTFEDIKGMLVGVVGPVSARMVEDLGAAPVTMMWYDFYQSLQKKVIDSCVSMITAGMVMNLFDYCKNVSEYYGPATFQGLSINLDIWKKMPPHLQKILMEEVNAHHDWMNQVWPVYAAENKKKLTDQGVTFFKLPEEERARWIKATSEYRDKQLTNYGKFSEEVRRIAQEANAKYPY